VREREAAEAAVEEVAVAQSRGGPELATRLMALQRSAGNAAVTALISRRPAGRMLTRYEAGEHARFGSDEKVMVNGVPISKGNIIAWATSSGRRRTCSTLPLTS